VRIDLRRGDSIKQGTETIGSKVKARVVKNKVAPPFRSAEFDIMFNRGISKEGNLVDLGVATGLIKKAGAFFTYGDTKLGQGRENVKEYLRQHPEIASELESKIRASRATPSVFLGEGSETFSQEA
jgi:recombination protein RecA